MHRQGRGRLLRPGAAPAPDEATLSVMRVLGGGYSPPTNMWKSPAKKATSTTRRPTGQHAQILSISGSCMPLSRPSLQQWTQQVCARQFEAQQQTFRHKADLCTRPVRHVLLSKLACKTVLSN